MNVNPGELNKKITIFQEIEGAEDANGFPTKSTENVIRTPWAKVTNKSGTEKIDGGVELTDIRKRFLIRYKPNCTITEDMRIRYAGKEYDILFVNEYGDNKEYIEIWTQRRG